MSTTRTNMFADIDRKDADAWAAYLAEGVVMRFGNADPSHGRDAVVTRRIPARGRCTPGQRGTSVAGTARAWLLADQRVTQIVVGPGRTEHLTPVREAVQNPLSPEERVSVEATFE